MKNEEAKFILGAYRPDGRDAGDAMFGEALKQAEGDPVLGAWFARQQAHDRAVAAKLREIVPPAGLREAILAGGRASGGERKQAGAPRRMPWLAMAAAIAVLAGASAVALWPKRVDAARSPLATFAMTDASDPSKHGGRGEEEKELQAELSGGAARLSGDLRVDFAALAKTGCRTLEFGGRPVLEVCFQRNGKWFHCYVARCEDFPSLPAKQGAQFAESGGMSAATWADGAHRFVVASDVGREAIARLL
jgi:anti-sigma factor RsiW